METQPADTDVSYSRKPVFGVVAAGKPLSRAVWTESRELAEDMLSNAPGDTQMELWEATFVIRSR